MLTTSLCNLIGFKLSQYLHEVGASSFSIILWYSFRGVIDSTQCFSYPAPSSGPSTVTTPQSTPAHTTQVTEIQPVVTKPAVKVAPLNR